MGILQSVLQTLDIETDDEEENIKRSVNSKRYPEQWQTGNRPSRSRSGEMTYFTATVPQPRGSSSTVNAKVRSSCDHSVCRGRREQVPVIVKCTAAAEGRWINHYSSRHRILLVGEGDFSFSTCLASAFGWASNMVATSLDSQAFLVKNYRNALSNLVELSARKCRVMHEIDATQMATHSLLAGVKFDRIVFNFPFAGFFKDLSRQDQIRRHRALVSGFMENAKEMLGENGEIHIRHKSNGFHKEWKLESVGFLHGLRVVEAVEFNKMEWAGYNTKCGFGGDNNFDCNPSITYKFRLS